MAMQTDVSSSDLGATASIQGRQRLKGLLISYTATTGAVELADGENGPFKFYFTAPPVSGVVYIPVPGEGILFETGIYCSTLTDCTLTVFYG